MAEKTVLQENTDLTARRLARHRGDYGFDAPYVPIRLGAAGMAGLVSGGLLTWMVHLLLPGIACLFVGAFMLLSAGCYVYTTRRGKFHAWATLLTEMQLHGDEQVIDLGCGRGAVLLMAARLLPYGKAYGVDVWQSQDQSGNALATTWHNAELEGVAQRVELHTADMRSLPFAENAFDLVLSSL